MCAVLCTCVCRHVCTEVRGGPAPSLPVYPFQIESFIEPGSYTGILRPIEPETSVPVHHSTRVTGAPAWGKPAFYVGVGSILQVCPHNI